MTRIATSRTGPGSDGDTDTANVNSQIGLPNFGLALYDTELEPEVTLGCGCHLLDRGIRGSRQHEENARPLGRVGEQNVALRPKRGEPVR